MDSPNTSVYVPLSLTDTLSRPSRHYRSIQAPTPRQGGGSSSSRPSSFNHQHSQSLSNLSSIQQQAKKNAKAMCLSLGLDQSFREGEGDEEEEEEVERSRGDVEATPKGPRSIHSKATTSNNYNMKSSSTTNAELVQLKVKLDDKDQEIQALKREISNLSRDKVTLKEECERLRIENKSNGGGGGGSKSSKQAGLDAIQLEELEKEFSNQEALLGGYQREAEKSLAELDRLRTRERRFTDWFERMHGPNWIDELNLGDKPLNSASSISGATSRTKLSSRPSLFHSPHSSSYSVGGTTRRSPIAESPLEESNLDSPVDSTTTNPTSPLTSNATTQATSPSDVSSLYPPHISTSNSPSSLGSIPPLALKQHLETVQSLIRSMETRLIARGIELEGVEKKAKGQVREADERVEKLERRLKKLGFDLEES